MVILIEIRMETEDVSFLVVVYGEYILLFRIEVGGIGYDVSCF